MRVPHLPQNVSSDPRGAPHWGHPPSGGGGFAAQSEHRIRGTPFRRTGFQVGVRLPQSAQVLSRTSDASTRRSSGRQVGGSGDGAFSAGAAFSGGSAIPHATATLA